MMARPATSELQYLLEQSEQAYFTFRPRPDQPERFDQQESFVESKTSGVKFLIGGNGSGTTSCAMHSVAKFILQDQAPPRFDTPFWVISGSYEQVMESCWKEKLFGHGHIPRCEVDWDRVSWYKPTQLWPYRVPLKPWPGHEGKNWVLEFKSYESGRDKMQARSLGGFCFCEQFPWGLLEEVLRGCREYNFPGSKMVEFTPVDPVLSAPLEDMQTENRLPATWEVWRANTECAKEAGHVNSAWFDEFFGMVSDEMMLTRLTGEWGSYEGTIYQGLNPAIHFQHISEDFPRGVQHRRSIDWGFGPENAFACIWAYRNGEGIWHVYDEYYSTNQSYTVHDHLNDISEKHDWPEGHAQYGTTWADPSSPDNIRIAMQDGFDVRPARNAVYEGIDAVRVTLKMITGIGKPGLIIDKRKCPNLARQLRTYRWMKGAAGVNPRDAPKQPLKKDDHAIDALRYLIFSEKMWVTPKPGSASNQPDNWERHGIFGGGRSRRRR